MARRKNLERWSYREYKKALDAAYKEAIEQAAIQGASAQWLIKEEVIRDVYERVWGQVSMQAATASMIELTGAADIVPDMWMRRTVARLATGDLDKRIKDVWANTRKQYVDAVQTATAQAQAEGLGIEATGRRIRKLVNDDLKGNVNVWRARRIAQTEVIAANNYGVYQSFIDLDPNGEKYLKVWNTRLDGKQRDTHDSLNGKASDLYKPFVSASGARMMHPGDSSFGAPAEETINCRCVLTAKPINEIL